MTHQEKITVQIAEYISGHLDQPLTVSDLSFHFQISSATLRRKFKQHFRQAVHRFIREKRLEKAYLLLTETNKPVKEVMADTGFKSLSSFTRKFHQRFQITPAKLRTRM